VLDTWSRAFFVVLDLPGFNPREAATVAAVAERVVTAPGAEVLLVASAATAPEETVAAAASLPAGGVSGLAITHLDSATRLENVVLAAIRTGLPLTFLSRGRRPALGLELATWEGVLAGVTAVASRRQETDEVRRAG